MNSLSINDIIASGFFGEIDIHFAKFILKLSGNTDPEVFVAAALVSRATGMGDICLDLSVVCEAGMIENRDSHLSFPCPSLASWSSKLESSPAVGRPGDRKPLVLDPQNRLYLYRYWEYEQNLAKVVKSRSTAAVDDLDPGQLKAALNRLFPQEDQDAIDWQKVAAFSAAFNRFCVIAGGPGTGKTFTIARILALILELSEGAALNVQLAAPTGKAAARLKEAINASRKDLNCSGAVKAAIPDDVATIHRMLKTIPGSPYFRHNAENPLKADIVLVDEASMVDLALMSKLVQAVPESARLILVGDRDQLASVEAGSVLGDICDHKTIHGFSKAFSTAFAECTGTDLGEFSTPSSVEKGLQDSIVILKKSYRFPETSGIGGLSQAVRDGNAEGAFKSLEDDDDRTVEWVDTESSQALYGFLSRKIVQGYSPYLKRQDPLEALLALNRFKILCAVKEGPFGVNTINRLTEQVLSQKRLIKPSSAIENPWYHGRPVLITANDYRLGLFNGDIGIMMSSTGEQGGQLETHFQAAADTVRSVSPFRLSSYESAYAMTVHKSQGSEFDEIVLILPDKDNPIIARELIYTGLTRARKKIVVCAQRPIIRQAIKRRIVRTSGLREALWGER
jgi:exodeoxyribonuclease V alpha subunit